MADATQIREQMEVVGLDDSHVGTVDHAEGDKIKLTKKDSDERVHHLIPLDWVDSVEQSEVRLNKMSGEKMSGEAKAEWVETGNGEMGTSGSRVR